MERPGDAGIVHAEFIGPSGRGRHPWGSGSPPIEHALGAAALLRAEVRHAGLRPVAGPMPTAARSSTALEVAPVVGADLLAVGRELAEWVAAPL